MWTRKIDVLDKGYIRLVQFMGNDLTVVNAARASYHKEARPVGWYCPGCGKEYVVECDEEPWRSGCCSLPPSPKLAEKDERLLRFLARNEHTSPFRHIWATFEVRAPLFVARQWWKHVVGGASIEEGTNWNEMSRRYVTEEPEVYIPEVWRSAPEHGKQGSGQPLDEVQALRAQARAQHAVQAALTVYQWLLDHGVAPEQARAYLPQGLYTTWWWTASGQAVIHFLRLRKAQDAQWEIRQYAEALQQIVQVIWPKTLEVWEISAKGVD